MDNDGRIFGSCLCGSVQISAPSPPEYINDCNCSACTSFGVIWGYYNESELEVRGETRIFVRDDISSPSIQFHFCPVCGSTIQWDSLPRYRSGDTATVRTGINMKLFNASDLIGVEIRYPDGAAWTGQGAPEKRKPPHFISAETF